MNNFSLEEKQSILDKLSYKQKNCLRIIVGKGIESNKYNINRKNKNNVFSTSERNLSVFNDFKEKKLEDVIFSVSKDKIFSLLIMTPIGLELCTDIVNRENYTLNEHDKVVDLLARWLVWEQELNTWQSVRMNLKNGKYCSIDVFSMVHTYNENNLKPTAYEIKVSRSDFLADYKNEDKRLGYMEQSSYLYYVSPPDVILKDDIKEPQIGLYHILTDDSGNVSFVMVKRARKRNCKLYDTNLNRLLFNKDTFMGRRIFV